MATIALGVMIASYGEIATSLPCHIPLLLHRPTAICPAVHPDTAPGFRPGSFSGEIHFSLTGVAFMLGSVTSESNRIVLVQKLLQAKASNCHTYVQFNLNDPGAQLAHLRPSCGLAHAPLYSQCIGQHWWLPQREATKKLLVHMISVSFFPGSRLCVAGHEPQPDHDDVLRLAVLLRVPAPALARSAPPLPSSRVFAPFPFLSGLLAT